MGALAAFAGHLCKSFADVELSALLQYLTNQLRSVHSDDLPVLRELISIMTVRSGLRARRLSCAHMDPGQQCAWSSCG